MLRGDGTKTRHVREQRYGNRHVCGQRRRAWHTRGRGHGNRHTRGRRGGARHTCKRRYRNCPSCGRRPGPGSAALFRGVLSAGPSRRRHAEKRRDREKRFHRIPSSAAPRLQSTDHCQRQSNVGRAEETEILSFSGTCAWKMTFSFQCAPGASFPLARNGRHRRFSGAGSRAMWGDFCTGNRTLHGAQSPLWEKRLPFSTGESPRVPKGTRGPFHLSLLFKGSGGNYSTICWISTNSLFSRGYLMAAWAAASRARGTRKGLQET